MSGHQSAVRNHLLAALPPDVLGRMRSKLTPMVMEVRHTICSAGGRIDTVCFPESGMISLVAHLEDGVQAEVGVVGREGMFGLPLLSGVDTSFSESMVQMPGTALRMTARDFRAEFEASSRLRTVLMRYSEAMQAQVMQNAACNSRHGLEQRLARWLLMALDRSDSATLPLTQDFIAIMLGAHRPSITVSAGILQRAGLIRYANGLVTVLDRAGLESASCDCYGAVQRRFALLLGEGAS